MSDYPPARDGYVTFGCLSNFAKVTETALATWKRVLQTVPNFRLILCSPAGSIEIDPSLIRFLLRTHPDAYFAAYNDIDVCLDPIGYANGATTLDAHG